MKTTFTLAALGFATVLSFGASAAELVTPQDVASQNLQPIGTISVSGIDSSPTTIREHLSRKADKQGASAYRVVEAYSNGNYHATAEIYK
ncbi:MAG: peroxide/acid stress response protein YhcN [Mixta calida]|uniref:DUF1471 domain-containing protein n=1 Tax=Mixta calida TaxID=665913 RepID=A0ABN5H5Y2_9GAMM|nr:MULTISPECIES: peroxide/acid stress response protein YhcN [Mixta]AIX75142.1 membrane protein [Pantoea sp. PSNIH2]MBS6058761.1 peroxide/acid stress response protein YhcN [Pantoea sp.]POU49987.1 DUF1471 domain-containing protein [Pantoea sp. PSNIH5]POU70431.1 DUF1471 domain-containing protein [Pantoea sp. PSNIH4]POY68189.1 DUF1471 domain-containing protein [Pantoea sp. PSNIH3]HCW47791.1 DUF1471 domain-containing protein [Erwiniaceae bacterium]